MDSGDFFEDLTKQVIAEIPAAEVSQHPEVRVYVLQQIAASLLQTPGWLGQFTPGSMAETLSA